MKISVPYGLPAVAELSQEGVKVYEYTSEECLRNDCVRIAFINLMPEKQPAERDMLRMLACGARDIDSSEEVKVSFIRMASHKSRHTAGEHIDAFYCTLPPEKILSFSAVIINGAPLERVDFRDVDYFDELATICDSARDAGIPVFYLCWGAFFGVYRRTGVDKRLRTVKLSGVYRHKIIRKHRLVEDVPEDIYIPHSRYCEYESDPTSGGSLVALVASDEGPGIAVLADAEGNDCYVSGHPEYSLMTLDGEYHRDTVRGLNPIIPENYYPRDNPSAKPINLWSTFSYVLMRNWLKNYVIPSYRRNFI